MSYSIVNIENFARVLKIRYLRVSDGIPFHFRRLPNIYSNEIIHILSTQEYDIHYIIIYFKSE